MGLFDAIDVAGSGLAAERLRMDVTAGNLANAQTTQGANGQPYRRREVVLQEASGESFGSILASKSSSPVNGVQVAGIVEDPTPPRRVYDPGHPDADAQGYVTLPNVNPVTEMVDLISASRSYEANVTAMQTAKQLFSKTLELLR
jgi:flagellar basal-body rod protein FlgC